MQIDAEPRSSASRKSRPNPKPIPGDPRALPGFDGHLRVHRPVPVRAAVPRRHRARQHARLRPQHHSVDHRHAPRVRLPVPRREPQDDAYWRDVGTLDAYFEANMDLVSVDPQLNMYDERWPIRTYQPNLPPPKFVFAETAQGDRRGQALDSIVCQGSIVSGGRVERSILGAATCASTATRTCRIRSCSTASISAGTRKVRRAIIDKGVQIPPGIEIGYDLEQDRAAASRSATAASS